MRTLFDDRLSMSADLHMDDPSTAEKGSNIRGTSGGDNLYGGDGDDTIRGLGGDDYLSSGFGDDQVFGGGGRDYIEDDGAGSDTLSSDAGDDQIYVTRRYAQATGTTEHVSVAGGDGNDWISVDAYSYFTDAYAMDATLSGGDGDDEFNIGLVGHASIDAGAGADQIFLTAGQDISLTLGAGADMVAFTSMVGTAALVITDFEAGDTGDVLQLRGLLSTYIPGWEQNNPFGDGHLQLIQRGGDAVLQIDIDGGGDAWTDFVVFSGHQPSDLTAFNLDGFPSDGSEPVGEVIDGTNSYDYLYGGNGADTINGMDGNDELFGGAGTDLLIGGAGADYLNGQFGRDTLIGGGGDDNLEAGGDDKALGGAGDDQIQAQYYSEQSGIAKLYGGGGDDQIGAYVYGEERRAGALIDAGAGNDQIYLSGHGRFEVRAGSGDDQISLENVGDHVTLTLGTGVDTVAFDNYQDQATRVTITDFEGGDGGDKLDLRAFLAQQLEGWDNSTNPFAAGYLRLVDQADQTLLQYSPLGDGVWTDLVVLKGVNPADLTASNLSGYPGDGSVPAGLLITGTAHSDYITGGVGPDTILGGKGYDQLEGGGGDDSLVGGDGGDTLNGNYGSDVLSGGSGDDHLQDSAGADTLIGGGGDDYIELARYYGGPAPGVITAIGEGGDDYIYYTSNSLRDSLSANGGAGNDTFDISNAAAVSVLGGSGDDSISVGSGDASIDAGSGNDFITLYGHLNASVNLGSGADVLNLGYMDMQSTIEVRGFGADDAIGVQDFVNWNFGTTDPFGDGYMRLAQHGHDAVLQARDYYGGGEGGWQSVLTLSGVEAASITAKQLDGYHHGPLWLLGGDGRDKLTSDADFNHLDGGGGKDVLTGAAGADVLIGGLGGDQLSGGAGADVFMYVDVRDSLVGDHDVITDLSDADTINLSQVDANTQWWGDQAFVLVDKFDGQAGELMLHYRASSDTTLLSGDTDGDGRADFEVLIKGDHADFVNFVL